MSGTTSGTTGGTTGGTTSGAVRIGPALELPEDHPGVSDPDYRERRAVITRAAAGYSPPQAIPLVHYAPEEDALWRTVSAELAAKHRGAACRQYLEAAAELALPADRVPQLRQVDQRLRALTGFGVAPVPGLVPTRRFYGSLAERRFLSTQYIRHHSVPFYTPEPDVVHELVGHATMLAQPAVADLYQAAGRASLRAESADAHEFFSRVFWFTIEFGLCREREGLRAYGAGLLSSYGEIDVFGSAELRPWDLAAMGTLDYDITRYQPVLFVARSFEAMVDDLGAFFDAYDDDLFARLVPGRP